MLEVTNSFAQKALANRDLKIKELDASRMAMKKECDQIKRKEKLFHDPNTSGKNKNGLLIINDGELIVSNPNDLEI